VRLRGIGSVALCLAACFAATPASAATHSNPTPILDPNSNVIGAQQLSPYPSTISVSGEQGTVVKARVTLSDVQGGAARDLDVLLVGPGGGTILFSDICSAGGFIPDFVHETFTFDDDASAPIPDVCPSPPPSGTYKPGNYDTSDNFPGISPPYPLGLANVRGTNPNGNWGLYAVDDSYPDPVTINGGWSLDLTTTGAVAATPTKKKCKKKHKRSASAAKKRCKKKRR
jgi:hypothetical protein